MVFAVAVIAVVRFHPQQLVVERVFVAEWTVQFAQVHYARGQSQVVCSMMEA